MKEDLLQIIEHFGIDSQQRKLQEEVFELQKEIIIVEQGNNQSVNEISEEFVDVLIILKQIFHYYQLDEDKLKDIERNKIERTLKRISTNYYEGGK